MTEDDLETKINRVFNESMSLVADARVEIVLDQWAPILIEGLKHGVAPVTGVPAWCADALMIQWTDPLRLRIQRDFVAPILILNDVAQPNFDNRKLFSEPHYRATLVRLPPELRQSYTRDLIDILTIRTGNPGQGLRFVASLMSALPHFEPALIDTVLIPFAHQHVESLSLSASCDVLNFLKGEAARDWLGTALAPKLKDYPAVKQFASHTAMFAAHRLLNGVPFDDASRPDPVTRARYAREVVAPMFLDAVAAQKIGHTKVPEWIQLILKAQDSRDNRAEAERILGVAYRQTHFNRQFMAVAGPSYPGPLAMCGDKAFKLDDNAVKSLRGRGVPDDKGEPLAQAMIAACVTLKP